jgi:hypothetical protein
MLTRARPPYSSRTHLVSHPTTCYPQLHLLLPHEFAHPAPFAVLNPERIHLVRILVYPLGAFDEQRREPLLLGREREVERRGHARGVGEARGGEEEEGGGEWLSSDESWYATEHALVVVGLQCQVVSPR